MATKQAAVQRFADDLLGKGIVDENFAQLVSLQDEANPRFVSEVVELFLQKSADMLPDIAKNISSSSFGSVVEDVHQFKGSSATLGAHGIASICTLLCEAAKKERKEECLVLLEKLKQDVSAFNVHMEAFLKI